MAPARGLSTLAPTARGIPTRAAGASSNASIVNIVIIAACIVNAGQSRLAGGIPFQQAA